jgi:hypothetical protein
MNIIEDIDDASTVAASSNQMAHARAEDGQDVFDPLFLVDGTEEEEDKQCRS